MTAMSAAEQIIGKAYRIGTRDALAGRPALDMDDAASAVLMDELGETGWTSESNYPRRMRMCEAYLDGYYDALSALGGQQ
jgi:hypothetical protein